MVRWAGPALVALAGCNALFGVDELRDGDGTAAAASGSGASAQVASSTQAASAAPSSSSSTGGSGGTGGAVAGAGVLCGAELCGPSEVCCVDARSNLVAGCADPGGCDPAQQIELSCDGPDDCLDAELCCGTWAGGHYSAIECRPTCSGPSENVMCGADGAALPRACNAGQMCTPSAPLSGYHYCA
jgi:hypothetical protein